MEKISFEILISALFNLGFDKVDPVLFTYTLGKLLLEDVEHQFIYGPENTSIGFNKYVDCSGIAIKIKDGYTLDTNVSPRDSMIIPLRKTLFKSKKLLSYLENFDFDEIVSKKANAYGVTIADKAPKELFSEKEIGILKKLLANQNSENKKLVK